MQGGIEKNNEIWGVECVSLLRDRLLEGCLELGVRVWIATIAKLKVFLYLCERNLQKYNF